MSNSELKSKAKAQLGNNLCFSFLNSFCNRFDPFLCFFC